MKQLEPYEEEVIIEMYRNLIISEAGYSRVVHIASTIKWDNIAKKHGCKKKFGRILERLHSKGYVEWHKSRDAAALTKIGAAYGLASIAAQQTER